MKNNFSSPGFLWPLLTLICLIIILNGLKTVLNKTGWDRSKRRAIFWSSVIAIIIWVFIITFLAQKGFFADFSQFPPRPVLALIIPLLVIFLIAISKSGTQLLKSVPPEWLVFMQSFRVIVELLLWFAFLANKLPVQISWEGGNLDVLTGILALPGGYVLYRRRKYSYKLTIVFNVIGILLLLNILVIAVLSMPTPIRYFMNEPSNALIARFPFILLPAVLVPMAFSLHLLSLRQLLVFKNIAGFPKTTKLKNHQN